MPKNGPAVQTAAPAAETRPGPSSLSDRVQSLRLKEPTRAARSRTAWLPWTLCAMLGLTTAVLALLALNAPRTESGKPPPEPPAPTAGGRTEDAIASSGQVALEAKGYIIPAHQILVSPKSSGMIMELNIEEGMRVKKDQVLAVLETVNYVADYNHARAVADSAWQKFIELYTGNREEEIHQAKADLDESEAQRKQLFLDYKRSMRLTGGAALAARDYEQIESQWRAMERHVEKLRQGYALMLEGARPERIEGAWADVETAEADVAKAKWNLDNCYIRAPVTGTILSKEAEIGNLVNPIAFNGSFSLCKMADLSDLEVELDIQERDIAKVAAGQPCRVRSEAFPDRLYKGVVSRLMPIADRGKGSVKVRVKPTVPREEEGIYLKPDMGAIVSFLKAANPTGPPVKDSPARDEQLSGAR